MTTPHAPDDAPALTAAGQGLSWLRQRLAREPTPEEQGAVAEILPDESSELRDYAFRFAALTALSAAIAALGLIANSGAVVIGAMLVAPLMTPITAVASSLVLADNRRLVRSMLLIALGVAVAFSVGWLLAILGARDIITVTDLPGEVLARTFPQLVDLGIAIAAGAAAGYIAPRRSTTGALPGVGIAVALVPPLAASGICANRGFSTEAANAFLLFLTNFAAIVFAAAFMLLVAGFRPKMVVSKSHFRLRLSITALAVVAVAVPLTIHTTSTLVDTELRRDVTLAVAAWDPAVEIIDLEADAQHGRATVELLVAGPNTARPAYLLAEDIRARFGGPVDLRLSFQTNELYLVSAR